ncbi:hypothetical protein BDC45DRAFT_523403 [Circinella umbellata]|nr:hypothetical protein BDC45DRAFT_523403 [Circinella umbellata]
MSHQGVLYYIVYKDLLVFNKVFVFLTYFHSIMQSRIIFIVLYTSIVDFNTDIYEILYVI